MSLAWGGYQNGQIPQDKLVAVGTSPVLHVTEYLEAGAAQAFAAFDRVFYAEFGKHVDPVEGYRSLARQQTLRTAYLADPQHEALAAVPGTSNHGYARAVDMGSGIASASTPEAHWARTHGPEYGFQPTGYGFVKVEPWHYDWVPGTATASLEGEQIMALDSNDKTWLNGLGQAIIDQLRGAGAYADQPLTIKAVRNDIGFRDGALAKLQASITAVKPGETVDLGPILAAIKTLPAATVAALKAAL